jgi:putative tryptophan/tyrosine transport system substrate-binding protein
MIARRQFLAALGGSITISIGSAADAQTRIRRIVFLASSPVSEIPDLLGAFRDGLREHGYTEGQNIALEFPWLQGLPEQAELSAGLAGRNADLIVAWGTPAVTAARRTTSTLPIVIVGVADPVGSGFVASLARPGGNVTGVSNLSRDLSGKVLEFLVEAVPGPNRVAVLRNPNNPASALQLRETESAARAMGLALHVVDARMPADLESAFATSAGARVKGIVLLPDPMFLSQRKAIADLARTARLPTAFGRRENVESGGLLSYGPSLRDQFRHAAEYVDRIFKGADPATLPVAQPTKFELVINVTTAKAIGLEIPPTLLARADEVIE